MKDRNGRFVLHSTDVAARMSNRSQSIRVYKLGSCSTFADEVFTGTNGIHWGEAE